MDNGNQFMIQNKVFLEGYSYNSIAHLYSLCLKYVPTHIIKTKIFENILLL